MEGDPGAVPCQPERSALCCLLSASVPKCCSSRLKLLCRTLPQLRSHLGTRSSSAWLCLVLCTPPALPSLHFAPPDDEIPRSSPPASPPRAVSEQPEMPADRCQSGSKVPLYHVSPSSVLRGGCWGQLVPSPVLTAASHFLLARLILTRVLLSRRVHLPRRHGAVLTTASHRFA